MWRAAMVPLAALALVSAACGGAVTTTAEPGTDGPMAATPTSPAASPTEEMPAPTADDTAAGATDAETPAANADALDFTARALDGGTVQGVDYAGGDVVLWMWASWCPNCNAEAPNVAAAAQRFAGQVTFIGVPGENDDDAGRNEFVAKHGLEGMVQAVDDDGSIWARYGVAYQPAWVFIDEDGGIETVAGGLYDDLDARVQALIDG